MATERQREARKWRITIGLFCVLLIGAIASLKYGPSDGLKSNVSGDDNEKIQATVRYTVVEEKISDSTLKTESEQHIVVEGMPPRRHSKLRSCLARRGFRYYNLVTNIFIYVYASKEQALAGQGLWIRMITKGFVTSQNHKC